MKRKWLDIGTRVRFTQRAASCVRVVEYEPEEGQEHLIEPRMRAVERDYGTIVRQDWPMITDAGRRKLRSLSLHPDGHSYSPRFRLPIGASRNETRPLTRWVITWEEPGGGYVVGLVYRQEGWRESDGGYGPDGDYPEFYLHAINRVPLYQIKQRLVGKTILVPAENAEPIS